MSWSPIGCFGSHIVFGFAGWYYSELCFTKLAPFIRFFIGITICLSMIVAGYEEHILCDLKNSITKKESKNTIHFYIFGSIGVLGSLIMWYFHLKKGKSKLFTKIIYYSIFFITSFIVFYYNSPGSDNKCGRDKYGQIFDMMSHISIAVLYCVWIYSIKTNTNNSNDNKAELVSTEKKTTNNNLILTLPGPGDSNGNGNSYGINKNVNGNESNISASVSIKGNINCDIDIIAIEEENGICRSNGVCLVISRFTGAILLLLFVVFIGIACVLGFIFIYARIYILGIFSCFGTCKKLQTKYLIKKKRVGLMSDYVLFNYLFPTIFGKIAKYMVEHEPTKYYFTHGAMIFFQQRYIKFVGSSIPDYNLLYPNYITYHSLYDNGHSTYSRLLPQCSDRYLSSLPEVQDVVSLFVREKGKFIPENAMNLSVFVGFYIRWFTHQFANTNEFKHKYINSPIGINLSQLYGSTIEDEKNIRLLKNGLLKSTIINGKEFPVIINDFNFNQRRNNDVRHFGIDELRMSSVTHERRTSPSIKNGGFEAQMSSYLQLAQVNDKIFLSPWNKVPGVQGPDFFCIQLLFWRHHQWIARKLKLAYPQFDDERIYEISKLCNILTCMQITLGLYGYMGIVQSSVSAEFDYYDFENIYNNLLHKIMGPQSSLFPCNSTNVFIEFNIMYRWHQLIPPTIRVMSNRQYKEYLSDKNGNMPSLTKLGCINGSKSKSKSKSKTSSRVRAAKMKSIDIITEILSPRSPEDYTDLKEDLEEKETEIDNNGESSVEIIINTENRIVLDTPTTPNPYPNPNPNPSLNPNPEMKDEFKTEEKHNTNNTNVGIAGGTAAASTATAGATDGDEHDDDENEDKIDKLLLPYRNYVDLLTRKNGLERFILSSSNTPAGKICLNNTEKFLCSTAVKGTVSKSRLYKLQSFNKYRERLGFEKYNSFSELTDDKELANKLKEIYGNIDNVEYYVGIFAENGKNNASVHGPFLTAIFSSIVFSLLTSSKLLRKDWNKMLTPIGKKIVNKYRRMSDLIELHTDLNKNDVNWKVDK